ncbi:transketolase family protein [Bradyrhizobium ottawaense]|uniref:transketolase family protein n=1 Tax=Bradyrhizobium ottawaense TaxID=931866 RepID=UPI0004116ABD|nr:transketolase C-terminal domain-containing protein [Bradyrhizobium ottawaense]
MRDGFVDTLTELAGEDERVMLVTADLGFGIFNKYIEQFPSRFLNVGVAEQNMIGISTGLALDGWKIFAYSIGNFSTLRCLEQIRNDASYHGANVNVVCSGGGFTYGNLGMSHHATEDISIMRALPGLTVVAPCDRFETRHAVRALAATPGVGYLRIEKQVPIDTSGLGIPYQLGKARRLREGRDVTIIGCGGIVADVLAAADQLLKRNISARVVSMHTLTPVDVEEIRDAAATTGAIVTVEENQVSGGLGGAVAEVCVEMGIGVKFRRLGLAGVYSAIVGDQQFLRNYYGVDASAICAAVRELTS